MPLILIDLDGTLVDSAPGIYASVRAAASALGRPAPTDGQLRAMIGPPLQEGFADVLGLSGSDVAAAVTAYRAHYRAGALLEVSVYVGITDLLEELRGGGHTLAVATSKPEVFARQVLTATQLSDFFATVHGATLDGHVRHKEHIVRAALSAHPGHELAVLIGDRAQDVIGARLNKLPCIGAGWGPATANELADAGAAVVCATPDQVPKALQALTR